MRAFATFLGVAAAIFLAFPVQDFLPPLGFAHGARILLVPVIFCYGALVLPFPGAMALAAYTGLLCDLAYSHVVDGRVEIAVGWSIVIFVIFGLFAQGFQPAFRRGQWWLHIPFSMVATSLYLALQFVMISFRREGVAFGEVTAWRILGSGLAAGLLSPLVCTVGWWANVSFGSRPGQGGERFARP